MKAKFFSTAILVCVGILPFAELTHAETDYGNEKVGHKDILPIILNRCSKCHNSQPKPKADVMPPNLQDPGLFANMETEGLTEGGIRYRINNEIFVTGDMPKEGLKVHQWPENERNLFRALVNGQTFNEANAVRVVEEPSTPVSFDTVKQILVKAINHESEKDSKDTTMVLQDSAPIIRLDMHPCIQRLVRHSKISERLKSGTLTTRERQKYIGPSGKIIAGGGWDIYRDILLLKGDESKLGFDPYDINVGDRQQLFNWFQQTMLEVSPMEFRENQELFNF